MEKKHRCKLCFRSFANGRALGGHMRSHMMKFYAEERDSQLEEEEYHIRLIRSYSSSSSPPSSSSSDEEYDDEEREAVRKSAVLVNQENGEESETEWSRKKSISRRSKRIRKLRISDFDDNEQSPPLSSISDATPEEHVAQCLIMLSRDKWETEEREYLREEDDDDKLMKNVKFRGKYRCEECNKLFRSYQALGGHRANHNKIRAAPPTPQPTTTEEKNGGSKDVKLHQCPFCDRIFSSGQALGGHKRSHFVGANAISTNCSAIINQTSKIARVVNIDLNLPAPAEEDDDDSQIAIQTVSD